MTMTAEGTPETPEEMFPRETALGATINESLRIPTEALPPGMDEEPEKAAEAPAKTKRGKRETWAEYSGKAAELVKAQPYAVAAGVAGAGFLIGLAIAKRMRRREIPL